MQQTNSTVSNLLAKLKERGPMAMNAQKIEDDEQALMMALGLIPEAAGQMQPAENQALQQRPQMAQPAQQPRKKPQALKPAR